MTEKGKALVVVVNKWDIAEKEDATQDYYRKELTKRLPFVSFAPFAFVSAKEHTGVRRVLDLSLRLVEQYRARFPTHQMNELLEQNPGRPPGSARPGEAGEALLRRPGGLRPSDLRHPVQPAGGHLRLVPPLRGEPLPAGVRPGGSHAARLQGTETKERPPGVEGAALGEHTPEGGLSLDAEGVAA